MTTALATLKTAAHLLGLVQLTSAPIATAAAAAARLLECHPNTAANHILQSGDVVRILERRLQAILLPRMSFYHAATD